MTRKQLISTLIAAFPRSSDENLTQVAMAYGFALDDLADGMVSAVIEDYVRGKIPRKSHEFRPSPAEVAAECRRRQKIEDDHHKWLQERDQLAKALPAPDDPRPPASERCEHVRQALGRIPDRDRTVDVQPESVMNPAMRQAQDAERAHLTELGGGDYATGCYREMTGCTLDEAQAWRLEQ
jgi:hypothetical protein